MIGKCAGPIGRMIVEDENISRGHGRAYFLNERSQIVALQSIERRERFEQLNAGLAFFLHVTEPDAKRPKLVRRILPMVAQDLGRTGTPFTVFRLRRSEVASPHQQ